VDGIQVGSGAGAVPTTNNYEFMLGAMDQNPAGGNPNPVNYYSGWMQELRIWNTALTVEQIRQMMNQHILDNGLVQGNVVPIDVAGLNWASLRAYYQMLQPGAINSGYLLPTGGYAAFDGQLKNIETVQQETAPLPYTTKATGNWDTTGAGTPWTYGDSVWDHPNSTGITGDPIDWNIVEINNNDIITTDGRDIVVLGLLPKVGTELIVTDPSYTTAPNAGYNENNPGHGFWITHYLKLDGFMNLIGESQLVQKRYTSTQVSESLLDTSSSGSLKRDQQGTTNLFNYNYLSGISGPIGAGANNQDYSISGNFMDGTTSNNPQSIAWTNSYNATGSTNPITLSRRWIYTYINKPSNTYSEWVFKGQTGTIGAGLGFTLKGSGVTNATGLQNYSIIGKPYNNTISNTVSIGNSILVGNPYPCALDADEFIKDNIPLQNPDMSPTQANPDSSESISGTLYFWDHYDENNTHILREYQGGYATYNLSGANFGSKPPPTNDGIVIVGGDGNKLPGRYVAVAQGFFVRASEIGGDVTFNNSQRVFQRETNDNSSDGSWLFRSNDGTSSKEKSKKPNSEELIKRVRLEFKTPEGAIRRLLLAFVPNSFATDGFDYGYDALNTNSFPSDLSWLINGERYVIQGVGDFDKSKQYPLNLFMSNNGNVEISLKSLENFDTPINVFVYDALLGTYTRINNLAYQTSLDADNYTNRFFIAFQHDNTLSVEEVDSQNQNIIVNYLSSSREIYVKTIQSIDIRQIYLINMIGQTVRAWNATNLPTTNGEIRIPISNISEGNYILKVETSGNTINKKIIIDF